MSSFNILKKYFKVNKLRKYSMEVNQIYYGYKGTIKLMLITIVISKI